MEETQGRIKIQPFLMTTHRMNGEQGHCEHEQQHPQSLGHERACRVQETGHHFCDQKGERGPNYEELHRLQKGLNSTLSYRTLVWNGVRAIRTNQEK